jgi:peroxiredoxin
MKTLIQFLLFVALNTSVFAENITFKGAISNIPSGTATHIYLFAHIAGGTVFVDSTKLDSKGRFSYTSKLDLGAGLYYMSIDKVNLKPMILSKSEPETSITATYDEWNQGKVNIKGSKENKAYDILQQVLNNHQQQIKQFAERVNTSRVDSFYKREMETIEDHLSYRYTQLNQVIFNINNEYKGTFVGDILSPMFIVPQMSEYPSVSQNYDNSVSFLHDHFWDLSDFKDQRVLNTPQFTNKLNEYIGSYSDFNSAKGASTIDNVLGRAKANPMVFDYCVRYLLNAFSENKLDGMMNYIIKKYIDTYEGKLMDGTKAYVNSFRQFLVGMKVNDFSANTPKGEAVALSNLLAKHKAVLLYFWSSEDKGSTAMNNDLKQLLAAVNTPEFGIMGIGIEKDGIKWKNMIDQLGLSWVNVSDLKGVNSTLIPQFNIKKLPHLLLLRADGTIVSRNPNMQQLMAILLEAFQANK